MWKSKFYDVALDSLICAQASRSKQIPVLDGDVAAQLKEAASGPSSFMELSLPPERPFNEAQYLRTINDSLRNGPKAWPGPSRNERLNRKVMTECGMSSDDVRKLDESQKIKLLLDKQRQKYVTPLEQMSGHHELFEALVTYPTTLDEVSRVVKTIVAMAHGDTLCTNRHCAVVDLRVVRRLRREYLEAENEGEILNREKFFSRASGQDGHVRRRWGYGRRGL